MYHKCVNIKSHFIVIFFNACLFLGSELSTCDLFQRHPDLLRFAGVHSLVINVMKSYFSFSETLSNAFPSSLGTENSGFVGMTQTLKLAVSDVSSHSNYC